MLNERFVQTEDTVLPCHWRFPSGAAIWKYIIYILFSGISHFCLNLVWRTYLDPFLIHLNMGTDWGLKVCMANSRWRYFSKSSYWYLKQYKSDSLKIHQYAMYYINTFNTINIKGLVINLYSEHITITLECSWRGILHFDITTPTSTTTYKIQDVFSVKHWLKRTVDDV